MLTGSENLFEYAQGDCNVTCIVTGEQWKQNTYIVTQLSSANTIIIDPGDNADFIISHILRGSGKVTRILLTHPHHDHVGAAARVSEYFNVECELHKQDVRLLIHAPMYALRFANKIIPAVTRYQLFEELYMTTESPVQRAIHTPGHTKGSTCYLFDGFVFSGDTLLYKKVGRTDLPGSSLEDLKQSIETFLCTLADETTIFPGHGEPWTIGEAKEWWRELDGEPLALKSFSD
jgi:hydroxyacylglutathione hydrolase